ncbi:TPA: hypothetical protein ACX6R1_000981 [Photobacterium damselae]
MGGRKTPKVQETEAQRAAIEVAKKQWDLYQNELRPYEMDFIERVKALNTPAHLEKTAQQVRLAYGAQYQQGQQRLAQHLTSQGIDPSSGRYQTALSSLAQEQALGQADTVNRAQSSEQDKYVAGLQDVSAIGMGQKATALAQMGDVANLSLRSATRDALDTFNRHAANKQWMGTALGIGTSAALRHGRGNAEGMDGIRTQPQRFDHWSAPHGRLTA